jgi:hypothetical protein
MIKMIHHHFYPRRMQMKRKRMMLLCLPAIAVLFAACPTPPDLTVITWIPVNPQGGAEPAFQNGWANSGGSAEPLEFGKDALGQVHISGAITNSSASGVGTTFVFTLTAGHTPAHNKYLPVIVATPGGTSSGLGELRVYSTGNVELFTYIGMIQYARFSDAVFSLN